MSDVEQTDSLIDPVPSSDWTERQREVIWGLIRPDGSAPNVIATFVRHPELCQGWISLSQTLLRNGLLPSLDREVIILRIAWRMRSEYEWRQHAARVDDENLRNLSNPSIVDIETPVVRDLIRSVDEFCEHETIGPANWANLERYYDDRQMLEVVFLCTQYRALATILSILRVQPDTETPPLPPLDGGEHVIQN